MPTIKYHDAFELTAHVNDLCVAHDVAGMHNAMLFGVKLGGMKAGDVLNVYGGSTLTSTFCECPILGAVKFQLRVIKLSNGKGYAVEYVA